MISGRPVRTLLRELAGHTRHDPHEAILDGRYPPAWIPERIVHVPLATF